MPQERLPKQILHAKVNGMRPVGRPQTRWLDYIEELRWNGLGLCPSKMRSMLLDREARRRNLELLLPQPSGKAGEEEKKKELQHISYNLFILRNAEKSKKASRQLVATLR